MIPLRNLILEKVSTHGTVTDSELAKMLLKDSVDASKAMIEKALLDLEILGLVNVSILAKGTKRIEIAEKSKEDDEQIREHDYEVSFPNGAD